MTNIFPIEIEFSNTKLISYYESLRDSIINSSSFFEQKERLGLALFQYKGFANWMNSWFSTPAPPDEDKKVKPKGASTTIGKTLEPEPKNSQVTNLLANMILGNNEGLYLC